VDNKISRKADTFLGIRGTRGICQGTAGICQVDYRNMSSYIRRCGPVVA
jgi:hypothetical protein